jgi:NADH dehydrogenase, FAD-containing subunit
MRSTMPTRNNPTRRRALLTFVVAGGGFSGAELAGGLNDFARGMLADYPNLSADDLRIVLVHSRERILPELSASLPTTRWNGCGRAA